MKTRQQELDAARKKAPAANGTCQFDEDAFRAAVDYADAQNRKSHEVNNAL